VSERDFGALCSGDQISQRLSIEGWHDLVVLMILSPDLSCTYGFSFVCSFDYTISATLAVSHGASV